VDDRHAKTRNKITIAANAYSAIRAALVREPCEGSPVWS
jgi:hypothetical protein